MANQFNVIKLVSVDEYGLKFEVLGTWKDKPYHVTVCTECDGRDIEVEPVVEGGFNPGGFNPGDFEADDPGDFHHELFSEPRFIDLSNRGYKTWELFPCSEDADN